MFKPRAVPLRIAVAVAAVLGLTTPILAGPLDTPTVALSLETRRMVFADGVQRASFSIVGRCVSPSDDVAVAEARCDLPDEPDTVVGTVRAARLGFAVARTVEAGPADAPMAQTAWAPAPEQTDVVTVELARPGDLTVTVAGHAQDPVDPVPVQGSAVPPGATYAERSVTWRVQEATPGLHRFTVGFRPRAAQGFAGSFVPEVAVELAERSEELLSFTDGSVKAGGPAERTARVTMTQRVSPGYGPPELSVGPTEAIVGDDGLPGLWITQAGMDGAGAYQATVSGERSVDVERPLEVLAPGAVGVVDTALSLSNMTEVTGQPKGHPFTSIRFAGGKPAGFSFSARTAGIVNGPNGGFRLPPQPGAGTIWDGDSEVYTTASTVGSVSAQRTGQPTPGGTLRPDWDGGIGRGWFATWANVGPAGEANLLNPGAYQRRVEERLFPSSARAYSPAQVVSAAFPVVSAGGGIDNRSGSQAIVGEPAEIPLPPGKTVWAAVMLTVHRPQMRYGYQTERSGNAYRVTPLVNPGGYFLESTGEAYDRDWSALHLVAVIVGDEQPAGTELRTSGQAVVPPGAEASLDLYRGGEHVRRRLTPGVWELEVVAGEIRATRIALGEQE